MPNPSKFNPPKFNPNASANPDPSCEESTALKKVRYLLGNPERKLWAEKIASFKALTLPLTFTLTLTLNLTLNLTLTLTPAL